MFQLDSYCCTTSTFVYLVAPPIHPLQQPLSTCDSFRVTPPEFNSFPLMVWRRLPVCPVSFQGQTCCFRREYSYPNDLLLWFHAPNTVFFVWSPSHPLSIWKGCDDDDRDVNACGGYQLETRVEWLGHAFDPWRRTLGFFDRILVEDQCIPWKSKTIKRIVPLNCLL